MSDPPLISIIVPTLNEGPNLTPLVEQIDAALAGRAYEVLIVDDNSPDETVQVCERLAIRYPLRLLRRTAPANGLSGAVLHGIAQARGDLFVVMDADLQHPPSALPALVDAVGARGADLAIGSRYAPGGSIGEAWSRWRRLNSQIAGLLARPLDGRVRDPMSGFFAVRRSAYARGRQLTPLGFKVGLEILCKCRPDDVREVPIHFAARTRGSSKLTLRERFRYLEHLSRLYDFTFPRASPIVKFIIVTAVCWIAGLAAFLALSRAGVAPPWTTSLAYLPVIAVTAIFHARYVRTQRAFLVRDRPWADFFISSLGEWTACTALAAYLAARLSAPTPGEIFLLPFIAALFVRYVLRKELLLDVRGLRRLPRDDDRL